MAEFKKSSELDAASSLALTDQVALLTGQTPPDRRAPLSLLRSLFRTSDQSNYGYSAPVTGGTVNMAAGVRRQVIDPAATLAALTVNLPPTPEDGQVATVSFTHIITTLTLGAPGGATVVDAPAAAAVGQAVSFIYRTSNTTWYPTA